MSFPTLSLRTVDDLVFLPVNDQGNPTVLTSNALVILYPDRNQRSCFTEEKLIKMKTNQEANDTSRGVVRMLGLCTAKDK